MAQGATAAPLASARRGDSSRCGSARIRRRALQPRRYCGCFKRGMAALLGSRSTRSTRTPDPDPYRPDCYHGRDPDPIPVCSEDLDQVQLGLPQPLGAWTLHYKENAPGEPAGKRPRTARRPPLAAASQDPTAADEQTMLFAGREVDVDTLIKEKMKGKNNMDYEGTSEQMMEYIKKLHVFAPLVIASTIKGLKECIEYLLKAGGVDANS